MAMEGDFHIRSSGLTPIGEQLEVSPEKVSTSPISSPPSTAIAKSWDAEDVPDLSSVNQGDATPEAAATRQVKVAQLSGKISSMRRPERKPIQNNEFDVFRGQDIPDRKPVQSSETETVGSELIFEEGKLLLNTEHFKEGPSGACKTIYFVESDIAKQQILDRCAGSGITDPVIMRAKNKGAEKELREEAALMQSMKEEYSRANDGNEPENLALSFVEMRDNKGNLVLVTQRADCDVEKYLSGKAAERSFDQSLDYCEQFLNGVREAHSANRALGDIKPDNCLLYAEGKSLKGTDFGKAQKLVDDTSGFYLGNPRYMPPEGVLSKQGDVFSAAMVVIRLLECSLENDNELCPVMEVDNPDPKYKNLDEKYKGIERFVIQHKDFVHCPKGDFRSLPARIMAFASNPKSNRAMEKALHEYIDCEINKIAEKMGVNTNQLLSRMSSGTATPKEKKMYQGFEVLNKVMKQAMSVDPDKRIDMETFHRGVSLARSCFEKAKTLPDSHTGSESDTSGGDASFTVSSE